MKLSYLCRTRRCRGDVAHWSPLHRRDVAYWSRLHRRYVNLHRPDGRLDIAHCRFYVAQYRPISPTGRLNIASITKKK